MGARGPQPKPTRQRIAEGVPGHKPLPKNEPVYDARIPRPPSYVYKVPAARLEYYRVAKILLPQGLISDKDRFALASYAMAHAEMQKAENIINGRSKWAGQVIITSNGNMIQNPWVPIRNKARDAANKFAAQFGLSPSTAVGIPGNPPTSKLVDGPPTDLFAPEPFDSLKGGRS